jgi:hypothetical protein
MTKITNEKMSTKNGLMGRKKDALVGKKEG